MTIAIHVDDIKVAGEALVVIAFRAHLTREFGELKFESKDFINSGVRHLQSDDNTVRLSQQHYAMSLQPHCLSRDPHGATLCACISRA